MLSTRRPVLVALVLCCLAVVSALAGKPREISGTLVEPKTRSPIAGQKLVLDRETGDYRRIPSEKLVFGTSEPVTIAAAVTDSRGHFRFVTTKDRGRHLTVRVSGIDQSDLRSKHGYAVEHLLDSLSPGDPHVDFDASIMHNPGGGFMPIP